MTILEKFGAQIKKIRVERGLTQERLAELSGLSRQYIGDVERGTRNIALINITKIAAALNMSPSELLNMK
jgi:transcriptional regulator with XRE-family HTH domain